LKRAFRIVRGTFDTVLRGAPDPPTEAFVKIELEDTTIVPEAMNRLRERYPNAVQLEWVNRAPPASEGAVGAGRDTLREPEQLVRTFYSDVTAQEMTSEQCDLVRGLLSREDQ
jgi:exonuclease SbcD